MKTKIRYEVKSDKDNFEIIKYIENREEILVCNFHDQNTCFIKKAGNVYKPSRKMLKKFFAECEGLKLNCAWFNFDDWEMIKNYLPVILSSPFYRKIIQEGFSIFSLISAIDYETSWIVANETHLLAELVQTYRALKINPLTYTSISTFIEACEKNEDLYETLMINIRKNRRNKKTFKNTLNIYENFFDETIIIYHYDKNRFNLLLDYINEFPTSIFKNNIIKILNVYIEYIFYSKCVLNSSKNTSVKLQKKELLKNVNCIHNSK